MSEQASIIISAVDKTEGALKAIQGNVGALEGQFGRLSNVVSGFAALAGVTAFAGVIKGAVDSAAGLHDMAQQTGATVESLSAMKGAAKIAGVEMEQVAGGLGKLSKNMLDASNGTGDALKVFNALGISVTDTSGRLKSSDAVMMEFSKALQTVGSSTERAAAAQLVFGKSGAALMPMLNDLSELSNLQAKVTTSQAAAADQLGDTMTKLEAVHKSWVTTVAMEVVPAANAFAEALLESATSANGLKTTSQELAADGSIKAWAIGAAQAGGYVIDVFDGAARSIKAIGLTIGAAAAQSSMIAQGNFGGAMAIGKEWLTDLDKLASKEQFSDILARKIADIGSESTKAAVGTKSLAGALATAGEAAASADKSLANLMDKLFGKDVGLDATYWKDLDTLFKGYKRGALDAESYATAVGKLTSSQKFNTAANAAAAKVQEDYVKNVEALINPLEQQAYQLEQQVEYYGMTESAIQATLVARLEEARFLAAENGAWEQHLAFLDQEIVARKRIGAASSQKEFLDANKKAAEESAKEWGKVGAEVERILDDALMRGFEKGKSYGQNLVDSLENSLKTAALKVVVNVVTSTGGSLVNGAINAVAGTSGANDSAGVNYLGLANNANSIYSLYGAGTQFFTGASTGSSTAGLMYANGTQMVGGDGIGALYTANGGWAGVDAGTGAASGTAAGEGAGAGTGAASTAGYIAAVFAAEYLIFQALTTSKTRYLDTTIQGKIDAAGFNGEMTDRYKNTGNLINDGGTDTLTRLLTGNVAELGAYYASRTASQADPQTLAATGYLRGLRDPVGYDSMNEPLYGDWTDAEIADARKRYLDVAATGVNPQIYGYSQGAQTQYLTASSDPLDQEAQFNGAIKSAFEGMYKAAKTSLLGIGAMFEDTTIADSLANFTKDVNMKFSGSLSDSMKTFGDTLLVEMGSAWLPSVEALRASGETWSQSLSRLVSESAAMGQILMAMGTTMKDVFGANNTDAILKASDSLVKLFGSVDKLGESFGAYYQNFYTQEEISKKAMESLTGQFKNIGLVIPETRTEFRKMVDSLDLTSNSGQATFKSLMDLQGSFAALVPASTDVATVVDKVIDSTKDFAAAAEALNTAMLAGIDAQMASISTSASGYMASLAKSIDLEKTRVTAIHDAASESVNSIKGVFTLLEDQVASLYGAVSSTSAMQAVQGNEFITNALSAAQSTGYLPDQNDLSKAITAARSGLDANNFATQFEADRAALVLAGNLSQLKDVSGNQLPVAEQALNAANAQLNALDASLDYYQKQVDELLGINENTFDMVGSIDDMGMAIVNAIKDQTSWLSSAILQSLSSGAIGSKDAATRLTSAGVANDKITTAGNSQVFVSSGGAVATTGGLTTNTGWRGSLGLSSDTIKKAFETSSPQSFYAQAISEGISAAMIDALYGFPAGTTNDWARMNKLPAFAVGTNYVPSDMVAQIHEGEAIIPKAYNPALDGNNNSRLEKLVEGLTAEVQRLQSIVDAGNKHASRTANAVNGNPEQPMLVETV